ncbi:P-loop containing nucleoside triphosphate hydrolase protein [Chytriomyces sp. MP71]|nr:P-loop containing nucleoside triphosphate hydrolase protein [Chytriomyces sp. MP71]
MWPSVVHFSIWSSERQVQLSKMLDLGPLLAGEESKPRGYQRFIFELAKSRNTIVVLPTGTGKTLISLLLIKHVTERDYASPKKRVSVFLAPHVPLVVQQTTYLRANCGFEVRAYHGDCGCDQWSTRRWEEEIESTNCLVMTPAICESALRRGNLAMSQINLIVFDECHNARKNSIYNQIIALHYIPCLDQNKPLIFGMTASPMSDRGKDDIKMAISHYPGVSQRLKTLHNQP